MRSLFSAALRRRLAVWICPDLAVRQAPRAIDPATLPVFRGNVRPYWWRNEPLREFLTASHRRLTLEEARAQAVARFGEAVPSISAIHRYWTRLDELKGDRGPQFSEFPTHLEAKDG